MNKKKTLEKKLSKIIENNLIIKKKDNRKNRPYFKWTFRFC